MRSTLFFACALFASAAVAAQTPVVVAPGPTATAARSTAVDSSAAARSEIVRTFSRSGFRLTLSPEWRGQEHVDETRAPSYAVYTFTEHSPGSPMDGARLRVERVTNLNPVDQERWRLGQSNHGYYDTRPSGLWDPDVAGARGFEVGGLGTKGVLVFLRKGNAFYTLLAVGSEAAWNEDRRRIEDLIYAVDFL